MKKFSGLLWRNTIRKIYLGVKVPWCKQFVNVEISARFSRNLARFLEISTRYGGDHTRFVRFLEISTRYGGDHTRFVTVRK